MQDAFWISIKMNSIQTFSIIAAGGALIEKEQIWHFLFNAS